MDMKVDGHHPSPEPDATKRSEAAKTPERPAPPARGAAAGRPSSEDRVEVSGDAQLVTAAVQAALDAPSVRPEAVERGRQVIDRENRFDDTTRLADRIIDSLIKD
jgi:hypothetical protein